MKVITTLLCICYCCLVSGQSSEAEFGAVYDFTHQKDSTNTASKITTPFVLLFNTLGQSVYYSRPQHTIDSIMNQTTSGAKALTADEQQLISGSVKKVSSSEVFYFAGNGSQFTKLVKWITGDVALQGDVPNFSWKLTDTTEQILNLKCFKARGFWKGRNYVAWFAPSIPTKAGPWKANGLPGLIIKMSDTKGEVSWELVKLYQCSKSSNLDVPSKTPKITEGQFKEMRDFAIKDMNGYLQSTTGGMVSTPFGQAKVSVSINSLGANASGSLLPKNPIERP